MTHPILSIACELAGTTPEMAYGLWCGQLRRTHREVRARRLAAAALRGLDFSTTEIAAMIGAKSHSTAMGRYDDADPALVSEARERFRRLPSGWDGEWSTA